jgi:hypothetical protein
MSPPRGGGGGAAGAVGGGTVTGQGRPGNWGCWAGPRPPDPVPHLPGASPLLRAASRRPCWVFWESRVLKRPQGGTSGTGEGLGSLWDWDSGPDLPDLMELLRLQQKLLILLLPSVVPCSAEEPKCLLSTFPFDLPRVLVSFDHPRDFLLQTHLA